MTQHNNPPRPHDLDSAIRTRILERAAVINEKLLTQLANVAQDLESGGYRDAINCLSGLERRIYAIRSLLFLLP